MKKSINEKVLGMEKLKRKVLEIENQEIREYIKQHGQFHSLNEMWAVVEEEIKETDKEIKDLNNIIEKLQTSNTILFKDGVMDNNIKQLLKSYKTMHRIALNLVCESIQTLSSLGKSIDFLDDEMVKNEDKKMSGLSGV